MSDAIADPDDIDDNDELSAEAEHNERDLKWHECPMLPRAEMLAIIEKCGPNSLGGEAVNLFVNALKREPRSDLLRHYVGPNLYHPGSHYIYTTPDPGQYGFKNWRPELTAKAIQCRSIVCCGLFSNPLAWIDESDRPPGERTYNAGFTVYTIEFDGMPLDEQLRIIYSGGTKRIGAEFRRYFDYRGYEIVYSGGKSLHFHFCFDLRHLKHDLSVRGNSSYRDNWTQDLPDCLLRPAYAATWDRLAAVFCDIAGIGQGQYLPDPGLKSWEQLRRCPWALRLVGGAHPLGFPVGCLIRQPVLASTIVQSIPRKAIEWLHNPAKLSEMCRDEQVRAQRKTFIEQDFAVTCCELELFAKHAPEMFRGIIGAEYPKFARFETDATGFTCFFYNGIDDRQPSSFCKGNRSRITLQGRHGFGSDGIVLAATPNEIFDWIVLRHKDEGDVVADDWVMRLYKPAVHDRNTLAKFLDDHLVDMVASPAASAIPDWISKLLDQRQSPNTHVLIRGPQGCGKSTKMMRSIPAIYDIDRGVIFFSSPSIQQAIEKVETFRHENKDERFAPFLYLSLSALYEQYCLPPDRLDHLGVLEDGGSSWLHAVFERQRQVFDQMFAYRSQLFRLKGEGKIPVLFGTHETMRQHARDGMTRLFYAEDFDERWFEKMSLQDRGQWRTRLLNQNRIHRVIVDEVTAHDLVSIHPREVVDWVQRCATAITFDEIWDFAECHARFARYRLDNPLEPMTWNLFLDVLDCQYEAKDVVAVSDREVPYDDKQGIYANMVGQPYYVRPRGWWNQFSRVTMLTTEAVPTRIVEALDRESASRGEAQDDRFKVYELGLPDSSRDLVRMELQRACKKETLPELVRDYHDRYPEAEIIADMVKARISDFSVSTHMSAKGSNSYIGSDIVAFYNALSPALFGELGALNSRFPALGYGAALLCRSI